MLVLKHIQQKFPPKQLTQNKISTRDWIEKPHQNLSFQNKLNSQQTLKLIEKEKLNIITQMQALSTFQMATIKQIKQTKKERLRIKKVGTSTEQATKIPLIPIQLTYCFFFLYFFEEIKGSTFWRENAYFC